MESYLSWFRELAKRKDMILATDGTFKYIYRRSFYTGSTPVDSSKIFLIMLKFNIKVLQPDEECPLKFGNCAGCPYFGTIVDEGIVCYADEEPSKED